MKELKFKIWDIRLKTYIPFTDDVKILKFKTDEYVIQQYTGLKDKNGKEIYEDDVVKYNKTGYDKIGPGIIEFFAGMFVCSWKDQTDDELGYMIIDDMEVIGNALENPELLK